MYENDEEYVNGPKIAADIMKLMDMRRKTEIFKKIEQRAPHIAKKINENMFDFNDIADLTPKGVQMLISEVAHSDLVLSFKLASTETQQVLLSNMSARKKKMLQSDFEALGSVRRSEVEAAQRRILEKLDELRTKGLVTTQNANDMWI
ncbi:MAG: hypothetical protein D6808_01245 [Candidatus Dadabacteria bacterium]|nr:MAG: hypothetical protein D6808_01245 [Candidatus Dadabacteria bacterium]